MLRRELRVAAAILGGLVVLGGCQPTTTVTGKVSGAVGVNVLLGGPVGQSWVTGRDGTFSFRDLPPGDYTLSPVLAGFVFDPPNRMLRVEGSAIIGQDFAATGESGVLDTVFGNGGTEVVPVARGTADGVAGIAFQPDGRMLLVGTSYVDDSQPITALHVHRLLPDGRPDPAFGSGGGAAVGDVSRSCTGNAVLVQRDGKLVAAGGCNAFQEQGAILVARFEADGGLDGRFGAGGIVLTPVEPRGAEAKALALQPDGALLVAAYSQGAGLAGHVALARYDADGGLDPNFGDAGMVVTSVGTSCMTQAIALQDDGSIVVAGGASLPDGGQRMFVARYTGRGMLDPGFGEGGIAMAPAFQVSVYPSTWDETHAIAVQGDGKLVAAGAASVGPSLSGTMALARWTREGKMDATFGGNSPAAPGTAIAFVFDSIANAIVLLPDGKLLTGGAVNNRFALTRWNVDGTLDLAFGDRGTVLTKIRGGDEIHALALQPDGKIVAAGSSSIYWSAARYWP